MTIEVELRPECFEGDFGALEQLRRRIAAQIRDEVMVTPQVKLVEPGKLPRSEGKAVRVRDERGAR